MSFQLYRAILSGVWMMDPSEAEKYLPLVVRVISGDADFPVQKDPEWSIDVKGAAMASGDQGFSSPESGVTAIIPITGPILKYSAMCGPRGLDEYSQMLNKAVNSPKVNSILFLIDSGGGQAAGVQSFVGQMKAVAKPSLSLIYDGVGASAAYWIATGANQGVWASTKTSVIGSIGTMISLADMREKLEKEGVKIRDIYATKSTNKNKMMMEALEGNDKMVKKELLDPFNETFLNAVKEARGDKIKDEEVFTGQTYMADKAVTLGLIDRIGSIQEAVDFLQNVVNASISQTSKINSQTNNSSSMKFKSVWTAILSAIGFAAVASEEEAPVVTEERLEQLNGSLEAANTTIADLQSQVSQLQGDLQAAQNSLATAEADRDKFKADAEKYGKQAGSSHAPLKKEKVEGGNEEVPKSEEEEFLAYSHNKKALEDIKNFS